MKKILAIILGVFSLTGCACSMNNASDAVRDYLNQYRNLSDTVSTDLATMVDTEDLTDEQKKVYKGILEKQYQDLTYEIIDEDVNGDEATVTAKITVYDLYKAQSESATYLASHADKFNDDNGVYDNAKYLDYKLDQMKKITDTVEYTIDFKVTKTDDKWVVNQPSASDLEKIHGIYNYETE